MRSLPHVAFALLAVAGCGRPPPPSQASQHPSLVASSPAPATSVAADPCGELDVAFTAPAPAASVPTSSSFALRGPRSDVDPSRVCASFGAPCQTVLLGPSGYLQGVGLFVPVT